MVNNFGGKQNVYDTESDDEQSAPKKITFLDVIKEIKFMIKLRVNTHIF